MGFKIDFIPEVKYMVDFCENIKEIFKEYSELGEDKLDGAKFSLNSSDGSLICQINYKNYGLSANVEVIEVFDMHVSMKDNDIRDLISKIVVKKLTDQIREIIKQMP